MWIGVSCKLEGDILKVGEKGITNYIVQGDGSYVLERASIEEGAKTLFRAYRDGEEPLVRLKVEGEVISSYEYYWFKDIRQLVEGLLSPEILYADASQARLEKCYIGGIWDTYEFENELTGGWYDIEYDLESLGYNAGNELSAFVDDGEGYRVERAYYAMLLKAHGREKLEGLENECYRGFYTEMSEKGILGVEDLERLGIDYSVTAYYIEVYAGRRGLGELVRFYMLDGSYEIEEC